jgi:hypothetical protein
VQVVRRTRDPGQFDNVNDGIARVGGSLICVYHADDVYEPRIVEREVEFFVRHPDVGAVLCLDVFIDAEGREYERLPLPPDLRGREVLEYDGVIDGVLRYQNRFLVGPSAMVRSELYRVVGPYRRAMFGIGSDLDMWLRIARHAPLGVVGEHLMRYRHFHGNSSQRHHHLRTAAAEHFLILDWHLAHGASAVATPRALAAHAGHRAADQLRIAVSHYIRGDLDAARATLSGIRAGPILRGANLQNVRLLVLLGAFRMLFRLPRSSRVADLFLRRWFVRRPPRSVSA